MSKNSKNKSLASIKFKKFMKNNAILLTIVIVFLAVVGGVIFTSNSGSDEGLVYGDDVIEMHYFHLRTCPHCHEQNRFHETLRAQYPNLKIIEYEISSAENQRIYAEFANRVGGADPQRISTPTTFIGSKSNVGFGSPETTGQVLIAMIEEEQARIDANWDEATMTRTRDLLVQE